MDRGIVPVEPPLLFNHLRPLFLHLLQKVAQGLDDVFSIDSRTLGNDMAVDKAFAVKKRQQHLLGPAGMDLCL
jgi:hypothetical protein